MSLLLLIKNPDKCWLLKLSSYSLQYLFNTCCFPERRVLVFFGGKTFSRILSRIKNVSKLFCCVENYRKKVEKLLSKLRGKSSPKNINIHFCGKLTDFEHFIKSLKLIINF